ncbi:type II and III secretion system protein [Planctomicrobium piriforme]|uniref:type II and III secretion system protein n=1 Tax=Planctomicrobium piriforme TaxID=1576369 RepID=UPI00111451BF|nr:type II and III secretion system protein [Planctomicrobium piriforme]
MQEVAEKKKQIAELQANVEKLELELGMAAQYMVVFSFCELDLNKFRSMKTTWESLVKGDPKKIPAKNEENFIPSGIVDEQKFSAAIQTLESIGALKILSNKRVCAYANQPSAYLSGEEVEVIQQTAGGPPTVARRLVGETLIATVIPRGENRSLLKLTSEFSGYGTRMITSADGRKFPEIYSRPLQTAVELKDEETLVLVSPQAKEDLVVHFIAVKVSPIRPMSSRPAAAETP